MSDKSTARTPEIFEQMDKYSAPCHLCGKPGTHYFPDSSGAWVCEDAPNCAASGEREQFDPDNTCACCNPNHALVDGSPIAHEIGASCMAEMSGAEKTLAAALARSEAELREMTECARMLETTIRLLRTESGQIGQAGREGLLEALRWIPVEEKLPPRNQMVLVAWDDGQLEINWYMGTKWFSYHLAGELTHWMPLPEPPALLGTEKERKS